NKLACTRCRRLNALSCNTIRQASFAGERSLRAAWPTNSTPSGRVVNCFKSPTIWKEKRTRWRKKRASMEIDHERYSGVLEQLRAALKICRKAVDTEVDRETVERLGGIL